MCNTVNGRMMKHTPTSRNPSGLVTAKPIALRLMPAELKDAERIAAEQHCSLASHARRCYLAGKSVLFPVETSSPRKRLKRGGGGNPAPTSSLPVA